MSIFDRLGYQAAQAAVSAITPPDGLIKYGSVARGLLNGDLGGAFNSLLDVEFGAASKYGGGNVALAGASWATLLQMYYESQAVMRERSNLFHIVVESRGRVPVPRFNLLATEFSYNSVQLGYDTKKIGGGFTQAPTGADPVEVSFTCHDVDGEIKSWFERLKAVAAPGNGTFGLLADYANKFTITHGAIQEGRGYATSLVLVPVSCAVQQDRKVEEFTALTLTFTQAESFGAI